MNFFSKPKFILISLLLLFLVLNFLGFSQNLRNLFHFLSQPLQTFLWQAGSKTANFLVIFSEIKNLKKEKNLCQAENYHLLSQLVLLKEIQKENKALREALDLQLQKEFKLTLVKITAYNLTADSIFINKGKNEGLSESLAVITPTKVLVGKISQVGPSWSEVMLLSHPESSLPAQIFKKEISGLVKGKGNSRLTFEYLPKKAKITLNDLVITTNPKGILIGKISKLKTLDISPFQEARIIPFFKPQENNYLFVLKASR